MIRPGYAPHRTASIAALRRTPRDMGESRSPGHRLWFEDVLGVYYTVDDVNLRVEVLFAGPARRR